MDIISYWITIVSWVIIIYLYQCCYEKDEIIRNLKEKLSYYLD